MSQGTVYDCIENSKEPITTIEISKKIGIGKSTVGETCRKLFLQGDIKKKMGYKYGKRSQGYRVTLWYV